MFMYPETSYLEIREEYYKKKKKAMVAICSYTSLSSGSPAFIVHIVDWEIF